VLVDFGDLKFSMFDMVSWYLVTLSSSWTWGPFVL